MLINRGALKQANHGRGCGQTQRRRELVKRQDGARPHRAVPQVDRQAPATPVGGATIELSSLARICSRSCRKWKSQQAILWAEVWLKSKKRKGQMQISELFVEERCSPAVLELLRSTGVGKTVPRESGKDGDGVQDVWRGGLGI